MIGLVLAGGGGKGFYQLGVYRALEELGVTDKISAISGTSAGAMNAVMFADGGSEKALKFWKRLVPDNAIDIDVEEYKEGIKALPSIITSSKEDVKAFVDEASDEVIDVMRRAHHVFTRKHVRGVVDEMIADKYSPTKNVFVTCGKVTHLKKEFRAPLSIWQYFMGDSKDGVAYLAVNGKSRDFLEKALLATSALPMIFEPVEIDGDFYLDGGIYDNVPVAPIYNVGLRKIIVVRLNRTIDMDYNEFSDADIIDILPTENPGSFFSGTLNLTDEMIDERLKDGYKDCMMMMHRVVTVDSQTLKLYEALRLETKGRLTFDNGQQVELSMSEKITSTLREMVKD